MGEFHAPPHMGVIADSLRGSLRDLAQSDARLYRELADITGSDAAAHDLLNAARARQSDIAAAIALLESHGYTVTRP